MKGRKVAMHRIEGMNALGLGRMDWDKAAWLGRRFLGWFALAGAMFLLCRAQIAGTLAPFAMAFLSAALLAGRSTGALLAGCMAGALNGAIQSFDLRLPIGAAIVLGGCILRERFGALPGRVLHAAARSVGWRRREARVPEPGMKARSPNLASSLLAGLGVLIPGLVGAGDALWLSAVQAVAASIAAVAAAPFFGSALTVTAKRRWLDQDERAGLFLLAGALAAGLARACMPLALCACGALVILLYPCGALAGVGLGAALLLSSGGDARLACMIALGGATAQLCGEMTRSPLAASACGAMLTAGLALNVSPVMLAWAGASALAVISLPETWTKEIARRAGPAPEAGDPQQLADQVRRQSVRRLRALGAAFGELAKGYLAPVALPDEQALIGRLRSRLCSGCAGYAACWTGEKNAGARFLCELIACAVSGCDDMPMFDGEVPPDIMRRCRRGRLIPERIQEPLEDFARTRRSELKRSAQNRLISAQFTQAQKLLEGLAQRQLEPIRLRSRQAERAGAALERAGIEARSVVAFGGRGTEVVVRLQRGEWTPELARAASAQLARAFGRPYAAAGPPGPAMRFVCRPRLGVETGVACASREDGTPSGDNHMICMLDDERLLALVCDGMGSGEDAARESAVAVRLLGRFLRSGARTELAIETVNALLLNRNGEDMFATVDMLILNLSTGEATFTKLAACPTLILRDGVVRRIEGGRLPLGILERVQPEEFQTRLLPGDVLLMGSDGVMEAAGAAALGGMMLEGEEDMPSLARCAMDEAEEALGEERSDDRTVICLRVKRH